MRLLPAESRHLFYESNASDGIDYQNAHVIAFMTLAHYGAMAVTGFTAVFTIFANMLTIFLVIRHRQLHSSVSNLYVLNLSFADLLIGLIVIVIMAVHLFVIRNFRYLISQLFRVDYFFACTWLCDVWQLCDIILSTTSLYSVCAIALDRLWNLEKPLRVFKRNRRIAKRLIFSIWVIPMTAWTTVYFTMTKHVNKNDAMRRLSERIVRIQQINSTGYYTIWSNKYIVPIVAVPLLYIPAITLIAMFIRISLVVRNHLKFLREHSTKSMKSIGSPPTDMALPSASNSMCRSHEGTPLRTPELIRKFTDSNLNNTVTSGYGTPNTRTPRSPSSRVPKFEWNLAPLSEEISSGRDRSHSEQIQLHNEQIDQLQQHDTSGRSLANLETGSVANGMHRHLRRLSTLKRIESSRLSVLLNPTNLAEILQRENVSRQVRAAKAVALILCSFVICWVPFLVLWPLKLFCSECVPDKLYLFSIWLNYLSSAINPLLYTLSSPKIRHVLRLYLRCHSSRSSVKASIFRSGTIV
ncbi:unnamed protein product [Anisakis simplex]|uniref:G_PROTEIN_RECEP_F1_2 domain-containing protein n=1 Tax=Anisakis simplex TaxID=6269 RepID=A0A0M3K5Y2_ANISI|nr:unnamed protein product [Anisakis simplex]